MLYPNFLAGEVRGNEERGFSLVERPPDRVCDRRPDYQAKPGREGSDWAEAVTESDDVGA